jgi:hypothetical protein
MTRRRVSSLIIVHATRPPGSWAGTPLTMSVQCGSLSVCSVSPVSPWMIRIVFWSRDWMTARGPVLQPAVTR